MKQKSASSRDAARQRLQLICRESWDRLYLPNMPHIPHTRRLEEGGGMQHFREALAAVLLEDIELPREALVTVLDAKITRDTIHAKGVLSVLPISMEKEVLKVLAENAHEIKDGLASRLRLRRIPDIHWTFDATEENAASIDRAIEELREKGDL